MCLSVHDSRLNYAKNSHQSLRDYREPPGRTTPHIGVTRHVVSMAFPIYFRYLLCGRPPYFNYGLIAFPVFMRVLLQQTTFEILTNGIPRYTQAKRQNLKGMTKIDRWSRLQFKQMTFLSLAASSTGDSMQYLYVQLMPYCLVYNAP